MVKSDSKEVDSVWGHEASLKYFDCGTYVQRGSLNFRLEQSELFGSDHLGLSPIFFTYRMLSDT